MYVCIITYIHTYIIICVCACLHAICSHVVTLLLCLGWVELGIFIMPCWSARRAASCLVLTIIWMRDELLWLRVALRTMWFEKKAQFNCRIFSGCHQLHPVEKRGSPMLSPIKVESVSTCLTDSHRVAVATGWWRVKIGHFPKSHWHGDGRA